LSNDRSALWDIGLASIVRRHGSTSRLEETGDLFDQRFVTNEFNAHDFGNRFSGDVVLGWPKATANNDSIGPSQCSSKRTDNAGMVVANNLMEVTVDANSGHLLTKPRSVRVGDLAKQQFRADR
jgi:hypothetical protein